MGIEDIRDALVVREGAIFLLTDPLGNVPSGNNQGFGVYHADTRHLSAWDLSLNGIRPVMLLSTAEHGFAMEQVMTNPTLESGDGRRVLRGTVEIRRRRVVAECIEETVLVTNYNPFPVTLRLLYAFAADFADIFDVRGYQRERHGQHRDPEASPNGIEYSYVGIDGVERRTRVRFLQPPAYVDATTALFQVDLPPRETRTLRTEVSVNGGQPARDARPRFDRTAARYRRWHSECTTIETDNEVFNRVLRRAISDVRMLWSETPDGHEYPAAGTPWFDAPFGRDSCILAMQMLAFRPAIARHVLLLLAACQGQALNPARDEEPGKILHEMRADELSRSGELPYGPYYGSIDSTPLFLMLAAEYAHWTNDQRTMRALLPAIRAALDWLDRATGECGFIAYERRSKRGLVNQGWKDSWDAIVELDGSLAAPPIALAEVQGYAYAARVRLAPALERLGERELAARLRRDAQRLRQRFAREFWMEAEGFVALALDGTQKPVPTPASNAAHCLWSGIAAAEHAEAIAKRLMSPNLFSGWGIRTLTADNPRFNPIGYHVGTVWPHDNSIAAMGFKMYGFDEHLDTLATALFDASISFPYFRLPELFCGDARTSQGSPVPYPVACQPQSWAAGAFPLIVQAILGLKAEAMERRLRVVNPRLPSWLNAVTVTDMRGGSGRVTLQFRRDGDHTRVEVRDVTPGIDVVLSTAWPV